MIYDVDAARPDLDYDVCLPVRPGATLGCTASGPFAEVYVKGRESGADPAGFVTEVRLPYAR